LNRKPVANTDGSPNRITLSTPGVILQGFTDEVALDPTASVQFSGDTCSSHPTTVEVPPFLLGEDLKLRFSPCESAAIAIGTLTAPFNFQVDLSKSPEQGLLLACNSIPPFTVTPGLVLAEGDSLGIHDAATGEPIANAAIEANGDLVFSDANGHFSMALTVGPTRVYISHPGYRLETIDFVIEEDGQYEVEMPMERLNPLGPSEILFVVGFE
jgi:hypothetical protein